MDLSLDQLRIFVATAGAKSFSASARGLNKAQSAVSNAIMDLEFELGVTLFDRSGRYPVMTAAGEALLAEAEAILAHCKGLKERADALTSMREPSLALAIEDAFPYGEIAPVLAGLQNNFPGVRLDLLQPTGDEMMAMVLKGEAMLGFGGSRANYPADIDFCRLGQVRLASVVRSDHPLARPAKIRYQQLADHQQLLLYTQVRYLATTEYLKSPHQWRVQSAIGLIEMLKQGLGWATLPRRLVATELAAGELVELKLENYPFTDWTVGLDMLWKVSAKPGMVAAWLKAELMRTKVFA